MNVPEQPPFIGRSKGRPSFQLNRPADVVQQRRRQDQIRTQSRVELRGLAAQGRHTDGVLEQPARVGVVCLRRRQASQRRPQRLVRDEPPDGRPQPWMRDLGGQELQEAVELRRVPP
jgi:hypothetical protein